ncbi:VOC family protein [Ponticaulis sp.]|uniref:VOC family protein n=1 Tax=Ponticaulis sp. TaxID=2020902 RepID=UPI000B6C1B7D|nr:VOC family protein [Ponticaulis sp.]MAJ09085.1 glyoxalase [Ponticaulis sp.]RPG16874.1 MAG: VOC family protein [Hyphomonadaceae bacterium TMED125]HBH89793.1 glyoxalase [Hyphomonadaceae bacterium]|tara:strand:+ start:16910 stop:17311 length:402 start_codon:yes stop_codon:yes gene_type:complete
MSTTLGVHHVGLSVPDLKAATGFFVEALGFEEVGGKPDYPSVFVSDGTTMLTLWQIAEPNTAMQFDRKTNIGLHHLALKVADKYHLTALHSQLAERDDVSIEFAPEPIVSGAAINHFICAMPGGIRIEFTAAT